MLAPLLIKYMSMSQPLVLPSCGVMPSYKLTTECSVTLWQLNLIASVYVRLCAAPLRLFRVILANYEEWCGAHPLWLSEYLERLAPFLLSCFTIVLPSFAVKHEISTLTALFPVFRRCLKMMLPGPENSVKVKVPASKVSTVVETGLVLF